MCLIIRSLRVGFRKRKVEVVRKMLQVIGRIGLDMTYATA
jgi:hypothetical protein